MGLVDQLNGDTPLTSGFSTRFKYKVNDKFDKKIPQLTSSSIIAEVALIKSSS